VAKPTSSIVIALGIAMVITAYRVGSSLASAGILPECRVLRGEECELCGLAYILVITEGDTTANEISEHPPRHFDLLRDAITNSHEAGHVCSRLRSDGTSVHML